MNKDKYIPQGYKPSPFGIIPEDWEVKKLGEVCAFLRTNTLSRNQLNDVNGDIHNIHYGDVLVKYPSIIDVQKQSIPFINSEDYKESMIDFIEDGDIVLADTAEDETVGKACEIANVGSEKILSGLHTMLIRPQKGLFSPWFLGYQVNSVSYRKQLQALIQGIKVCSLGKQAIANTYFAVPPLPEQHRIVSVLSLWDTAIEKQTALIEKLTLRKRGLMQQLLTGKKRLKGFGGEWKEVRLGEIGVFFKGGGVPKNKITNSGNKCLTYGDLYTKYDFVISDVKSYIDDHTANESVKIRYGDICFAGSGETKEDIGKCAVFIDNEYGYAGGDIIVFRANDCNPITLSYILNSSDVIRQKSNMGQGHSVVHIYPYQLEKLLIKLPSRAEQDAIATILMESDKEIEIQKQKLAAMQEEKKGLMQVLLTGKKRVK